MTDRMDKAMCGERLGMHVVCALRAEGGVGLHGAEQRPDTGDASADAGRGPGGP